MSLFLSAAVYPALSLFAEFYIDFHSEYLLFPLSKDLSLSWSFWLLVSLFIHLLAETPRLHMIPMYLLMGLQSTALFLHLNGFKLNIWNLSQTELAVTHLAITAITLALSLLFPIPSIPKKGTFNPSFIDTHWTRITSHQTSGFVKIPVRLYYPALDTGRNSVKSYYNAGIDAKSFSRSIFGIFSMFLGTSRVQTNSIHSKRGLLSLFGGQSTSRQRGLDKMMIMMKQVLPLDETLFQYPVAIVSQDYNGLDVDGMHLFCENMCQLGYVVLSVKHTNDGCKALNPFGLFNPKIPVDSDFDDDGNGESSSLVDGDDLASLQWRKLSDRMAKQSHELSFVLDRLMAIQFGQAASIFGKEDEDEGFEAHLLKARLDLERITLIGHSFTASTALFHACEDRRIRSVICINGWMEPLQRDVLEAGLPCPVLMMQSASDTLSPNNDDLVRTIVGNSSHAYFFRMKKSKNFDILDLFHFAPAAMKLLGLCGAAGYKRIESKTAAEDETASLFGVIGGVGDSGVTGGGGEVTGSTSYKDALIVYVREFLMKHGSHAATFSQQQAEYESVILSELTPKSKSKALSNGFSRSVLINGNGNGRRLAWPILNDGKQIYEGIELVKTGWLE